jgi:hypothetical protein
MIQKISSTALMLCIMASGFQAQQKRSPTQVGVRIKKDRPAVYLTFERIGRVKVPEVGEGYDRIWLRFHNNTRWPIMLEMADVTPGEYGDAELFYDVLSGNEVIVRRQCHACTLNALGSGRSMTFSVPDGNLAKGRTIRVRFSFSWEDQNDVYGGREAVHYVCFDAAKLPQSGQKDFK